MRRTEFCRSRGLSFGTLNRHLKKQRWKRKSRRASSSGRLVRVELTARKAPTRRLHVCKNRADRAGEEFIRDKQTNPTIKVCGREAELTSWSQHHKREVIEPAPIRTHGVRVLSWHEDDPAARLRHPLYHTRTARVAPLNTQVVYRQMAESPIRVLPPQERRAQTRVLDRVRVSLVLIKVWFWVGMPRYLNQVPLRSLQWLSSARQQAWSVIRVTSALQTVQKIIAILPKVDSSLQANSHTVCS